MTHYSEADLLETYYTQPGESMPVMMHLASCAGCSARYDRLDRKLREAAVCHTEKPETFWSRQRLSITRRVNEQRTSSASAARVWRVAAAAMLSFFLGGAVVYETALPKARMKQPAPSVVSAAPADVPVHDAWDSDELQEFHTMVEWEAWTK